MPNLRTPRLYTGEEIRNSPSRTDGLSEVLENEYRRKTCLFIKAAGKALDLPVEAVATALVFFHKFFMLHSFLKHERLFVASACLFLAAKVEESPKRVELVMSKCWAVWHNREPPAEQEKAFKRLREKILIAERCLLHTLGFQMTVEHPYAAVMGLLKKLFSLGRGADGGKGVDKTLNRQLSQAATSFVNDSLLTTVCVRYRPDEVAAAVVYLSYLYMGLPRVDAKLLDTDEAVVAGIECHEDISDSVLSLYDEHGAGHATLMANELRDKLKGRMLNPTAPTSAASSPAPTPSPRPPASPRPTPSPSPHITGGVASTASFSPRVGNSNGSGNGNDNVNNNATTTATATATVAATATASTAPSAATSANANATATTIATATPEGTVIERKDGGSDGGCSKADPPAEEEGKRNRGPCDSPPTERSPKKRKAGEGGDEGVKGPEGEGQTIAVDPKRPKSL